MESQRIADQIRRSVHGPAWHGPAVLEALRGVSAQQAAAHPVPNAHSIWELALHIGVWVDEARARLEGAETDPTPEEDWPTPRDTSPAAWQQLLVSLEKRVEDLCRRVAELSDARLQEKIWGEKGERVSAYGTLHGVAQHNTYHAGQIALLKKF